MSDSMKDGAQKMRDDLRKVGCGWRFWCVLGAIVVLTALLLLLQGRADLGKIAASLLVVLLGLFAAVVLSLMMCGRIDLSELIEESDGGASLSRFQFLIFTFVIAGCYLALVLKSNGTTMVEIPGGVLGLIGISGGSYVGSKVVQKAAETAQKTAEAAQKAHVAAAPTQPQPAVPQPGAAP